MPVTATAKLNPKTEAPPARGPGKVVLNFNLQDVPVACSGMSGPEPNGRWTDGHRAKLMLPIPGGEKPMLLLTIDARAFTEAAKLPQQRVRLSANGTAIADLSFHENLLRRNVVAVPRALADGGTLTLDLELPDCAQPVAIGHTGDQRHLGIMIRRIAIEALDEAPPPSALIWQYGRPVGGEAAKSFDRRIENGFWNRFINGPHVLDVGFRGYGGSVLPIVEGAIGVDLDYPGYDGTRLPFDDGSQDAVFSSHCLEHIASYLHTIQDWYRVTKVGGHIITAVPNAALYERRRRPPSRWNDDHKRFYSPASLLAEFEAALAPNSYRVRFLEENDSGYRYGDGPDVHPFGCYEIVLVIEKLTPPKWALEG
jgi:hypothetical protein